MTRDAGKRTEAAALLLLLVGLGAQAIALEAPFDGSLGERISAGYTAYTLSAWEADGLLAHDALWTLNRDPENPASRYVYVNHPVLPVLWLHAVGELLPGLPPRAAARLGVLLWIAAAAWALSGVAPSRRLLVAGLFFVLPSVVLEGRLLCPPLFALLPFALLLRQDAAGPARIGAALLSGGFAALCDWNTHGPVLVVALAWLVGGRARAAFGLCAGFGLGVLLHFGHAAWALGGIAELLDHLEEIRGVLLEDPVGPTAWASALFAHLRDREGELLLGGAILGLLVGGLRRREARTAPLLRAATLAGAGALVSLFTFRERTHDHPFWILLLAPTWTLALALLVEGVRRGGARPLRALREARPLLAAALLLLVGGFGLLRGLDIRAERAERGSLQLARALERLFPGDTLLVAPGYVAFAARAECRVPILPAVGGAADLVRRLEGRAGRRVFVVLSGGLEELASPRHAWVRELPFRPRSERIVFVAGELLIAELDVARFLEARAL